MVWSKLKAKQGDNSIFPRLPYDTHAIAMVGFSVDDRVVCGADKVLGNKSAKQRYGRLFRKELQGVVKGREADVAKSMWFVLTRLQLRRLFPLEA